MKNYLLGTALIFALALVFESMGWWQAMIVAGMAGSLFVSRSFTVFCAGFLGVAAAWLVQLIIAQLGHPIVPIMTITGQIFRLPKNWSFLLLLLTLLLGGLLGGLGGVTGLWWRKTLMK
ncbi:MAG: hypothetical protein ONB11_10920 [candidate division KSB1 bacterium]|nr:hypothetical protein [candidate division KSB1 bacterium]MDZ7340097.1 hypothetical protein [candidate division KSB1 bacterium]